MTASDHRRTGPVAGLVLAAGAGRRFGSLKQLAPYRGRPLVEHSLAVLEASPVDIRVVVLGADAERITAEADLRGAEPIVCDRWETGQAASLAAGIAAARERGAVAAVILLGDEPLISPAAVERVLGARGERPAVRATYGGRPGHPVLLEEELFAAAVGLRGDTGARILFGNGGESVTEVACDDLGSGTDVDTVEALRELDPGGS